MSGIKLFRWEYRASSPLFTPGTQEEILHLSRQPIDEFWASHSFDEPTIFLLHHNYDEAAWKKVCDNFAGKSHILCLSFSREQWLGLERNSKDPINFACLSRPISTFLETLFHRENLDELEAWLKRSEPMDAARFSRIFEMPAVPEYVLAAYLLIVAGRNINDYSRIRDLADDEAAGKSYRDVLVEYQSK